jgi:ATP-dependent Lhr-like helicase
MGDRVMDTLAAMLRAKGMKAANEGIAIVVTNVSPDEVQKCLCALQKEGLPDAYELARSVVNKATEKHDLFLTDELLSADYAAAKFDGVGAFNIVKELMANGYEN